MSADYHKNTTHVSRSMLAVLADSPRTYESRFVTGKPDEDDDNDNLSIGTGTHAIALNDVLALENIVVIPKEVLASNGAKSTNAYKEFAAKHAGKTLLKEEQKEICEKLAEQLDPSIGPFKRNPRALLEHEVYWTQCGIDCRAKLDLVVPMDDEVIVIDLKTAADIKPWKFRKAIIDRRLWLQDAHYSAGVQREFGLPVRFIFVAVHKTAPYRVRNYELNESDKAEAARRHEELLESLAYRREHNDWSEIGEGDVITIEPLGEYW